MASLYIWFSGLSGAPPSWVRREAQVIKERGKYKLWSIGRFGSSVWTLKGEYLETGSARLRRVP
jgi:hypothetical protein